MDLIEELKHEIDWEEKFEFEQLSDSKAKISGDQLDEDHIFEEVVAKDNSTDRRLAHKKESDKMFSEFLISGEDALALLKHL